MNERQRHTRRSVLGGAVGLAGLTTSGVISRAFAQETPGPRPPVSPLQTSTVQNMTGTQVVLLGTRAGPGVDLKRAQTATAIMVDSVPYLVDCGYGTVRNLSAGNIDGQKIEKLIFTHLHNDHTTDTPALLSLQWTGGRTTPLDCYGPYGTAAMVRAIVGTPHRRPSVDPGHNGY